MRIEATDFWLGVAIMVFSAGYLALCGQVQESLLSDAVGAAGLPRAVAWSMIVLGGLLTMRSLRFRPATALPREAVGEADDAALAREDGSLNPHLKALGLLAMLALFVFVMPFIGYIAATAVLLCAVAFYGGAVHGRNLAIIAVAGALGLWFLFDFSLHIPLPVGSLWEAR